MAGEEEEESLEEEDSGIRESSESSSTADIASDSSGALPYRPDPVSYTHLDVYKRQKI